VDDTEKPEAAAVAADANLRVNGIEALAAICLR